MPPHRKIQITSAPPRQEPVRSAPPRQAQVRSTPLKEQAKPTEIKRTPQEEQWHTNYTNQVNDLYNQIKNGGVISPVKFGKDFNVAVDVYKKCKAEGLEFKNVIGKGVVLVKAEDNVTDEQKIKNEDNFVKELGSFASMEAQDEILKYLGRSA